MPADAKIQSKTFVSGSKSRGQGPFHPGLVDRRIRGNTLMRNQSRPLINLDSKLDIFKGILIVSF